MARFLDKDEFKIDINELNPNGFCLIHVDLDDGGKPVDWTFIYVNHKLAEIEGKTVEELTDHRFFEIFPNGDRKWLKPYYAAAYEGKEVGLDDISEEIGRYLHVDCYPTGREGYCICMMRDIKQQMYEQAQHRIALENAISELENEKRLNARVREFATAMGTVYPLAIALDYTNDSYHMVEYDSFINKTAARSGDIDTLIHVGASTIPDPGSAQRFWDVFNRKAAIAAFQAGNHEIVLRHPQNGDDGKIHYMDTRVICTELSEDRIEAISISKCIDDEAELERVYAVEKQHAEVIDAVSTLYTTIVQLDLRTHAYCIFKNADLASAVANVESAGNFDLISDNVIRHFVQPDFISDARVFLDINTLSERLGDKNSLQMEFKDANGAWLEATFIAQEHDEQGRVFKVLYVSRIITAEKEKELNYREQLRVTALEAEKANVSKTSFLRRMSHDIRTPLNGITGMLRIADKCRDDSEKFNECMGKILRSSDYLLDLVNNVLDISKLESGSIVLEDKPFNLGLLLLSVVSVIEVSANEHGVTFIGGGDGSHIVHYCIIGSPLHLNRVLMNIASNAVKYNRPGGSVNIYCNELSSDDESATYEFVCEDTGLGMSEEFQKHAFDPFTQEGKQTTTSFSGSGLGLSIVHDIVALMGGTTELKSMENVGTTIRVVLTFKLDKECRTALDTVEHQQPADFHGIRAMVVEDNELNLEIARTMLEELGIDVTAAENGLVALDTFDSSPAGTFDCIFMDMMMPEMGGLEATRRIRALDRADAKTVPIIAMTANAFLDDRQACFDAGMNDHIGKPINIETLKRVITKQVK